MPSVLLRWLLAALLCRTSGWVATAQAQRDAGSDLASLQLSNGALNRLWNTPLEATSSDGLGGGLTFAYDQAICDDLLPAFSEASGLWGVSFVDCDTIFAAIRTAFASWSTNHPHIKFNDVTADCLALGDETGGPFGRGCSRAEIYLTTSTNSTSQDVAATTINEFRWEPNFRHPNGLRAEPGAYATVGSIVSFATGSFNDGRLRDGSICWYIDSSFCSGFHRLKRSLGADNVLLIGKTLIFIVWGLGIAWACANTYSFALKTYRLLRLELDRLLGGSSRLRSRCKQLLEKHDVSQDGALDRHELRAVLEELQEGRPNAAPWTDAQVAKIEAKFLAGDGAQLRGEPLLRALGRVITRHEAAHWALSEEGSLEWRLAFERLSKLQLAPVIALLTVMVCPIIFYTYIFIPCWECYDFTAAATHEVGHVLGLTHPDDGARRGLNFWYARDVYAYYGDADGTDTGAGVSATPRPLNGSLNGSVSAILGAAAQPYNPDAEPRLDKMRLNCTRPWERVRIWPNSSAANELRIAQGVPGAAEARDFAAWAGRADVSEVMLPNWQTIMATFTFNNPSTCVFQDDLDALNVLYPVCDNAVLQPQCDQPRSYLGLVRLAAYVGVPVTLLLLTIILVHTLTLRCHECTREALKREHADQLVGNETEMHFERLQQRRKRRGADGKGRPARVSVGDYEQDDGARSRCAVEPAVAAFAPDRGLASAHMEQPQHSPNGGDAGVFAALPQGRPPPGSPGTMTITQY